MSRRRNPVGPPTGRINPIPAPKNNAPLVADFDGGKFAALYGLMRDEFHVSGGRLFYPPSLGADPLQEACDPKPVRPDAAISAVKSGKASGAETQVVLAYMLEQQRL